MGKPREYVFSNAPSVLEMVAETEMAMEKDPTNGSVKKTKEMLLKELRNDIEEPWCCVESLAPIKGFCTALTLCILNFLQPGLGTLISACIA